MGTNHNVGDARNLVEFAPEMTASERTLLDRRIDARAFRSTKFG